MSRTTVRKIVIVGSGNLAWHLAKEFRKLSHTSVTIYNHRQNNRLQDFKKKLNCEVKIGTDEIVGNADFYFICVSDKAISDVAHKINISNPEALLIHTSGSMELEVLGKPLCGTGVFYPLQSFSTNDEINWKEVPILIEASSKKAEKRVEKLANHLSNTVKKVNYKSRLLMHLAAVIVNNFTNSLYVEAKQLLERDSKLKFKWLLPLVEKTTSKIKTIEPKEAQTGPAKRRDVEVMQKHYKLLHKKKDLLQLYKSMNNLIIKQQK